ncbi:cation:proton antiporter [Alloyangia pacifica]|uniref:cation:proton antiporter n=1 Tax=Alloyangia pacifica TaxID=311180 RepID=UPI001CD5FD24|nr:cation:proton antiporter [Alloyangia pacifica]MCA0995103.1 cation:proton antiporter [Alloyangia pacifica]
MDVVLVTAVIASLFLVIAAAEPLAARLRLPYSAILALLGTLIGAAAIFFLRTDLTDALNPVAAAIINFPIRSNVFLYVFLPTLLFQATLGMNLRRMLDDWVPILVLAIVAVVAATVFVGFALSWTSSLPLAACFLVGAIVSTTDPSAVVSIFRSIAAPRRLVRIIEGESLLNDAAAIALFSLFMGFVMEGVPDPTLGGALAQFPMLLGGGALAGWLVAQGAIGAMALLARYEKAQLSVSIALPYLAYIGAEQLFGASGVIAVVTAGITLNLVGPGKIPPTAWANLNDVWDILSHWAGALIFILAALLIPRLLEDVHFGDFLLILVVTAAAIAARGAILSGLLPILRMLRLSPRIERPYRVAILWGGLRGALTLALALAVTESFRVPIEVKRVVGILATGFTLWTLLVQGTTLTWVIKKLGLDRLGPLDQALSNQVVAVALQTVREQVSTTTDTYGLDREIVRSEAKRFGKRLDAAVKTAEEGDEIQDRDRVTLGLIALGGAERDATTVGIRERTISLRLAQKALSDCDRLIEGARSDGRVGYQRAAKANVRYGNVFRAALFAHNRLHISGPLARLTADRFDLLLSKRQILRDLEGFIDGRIRRIHGRRVAELLRDLLTRRREATERALEGLRLQYPGYAEELERRFIRRTALRLEEGEYDTMHEDGLIGDELYTALSQDLARRRAQADERPPLDLSVQRAELVRRFPLFADLEEKEIRPLARGLRTRYVAPGDVISRRDSTARSVYFIASGAVEQRVAGHTYRLGRGDMCGQLALLMPRRRRSELVAITPSTLLELDETRFKRLLKRSARLREAVRESATRRGLDLNDILGEAPEVAKALAKPDPKPAPKPTPEPEANAQDAEAKPEAVKADEASKG